jgi:membrane associated rhomboid family serine protease
MNDAPELEQPDNAFVEAIQQRPVKFTYVILGFNFLIFALMSFAGGTTNENTLVAFGAKENSKIHQGEIWRFLTPVFIHIGIIHLLSNSYALWAVGPQVEKLYGGARFVILYLTAGIAGVIASYQFNPDPTSAGASGAIFGLFGVLLAFGIRNRSSIPPFFRQAMMRAVLPVIAINLLIGQTVPYIDNSAHIGGLLGGAALAFLIPFERPGTSTSSNYRAALAFALILTVVSFFEVYRHYDGPAFSVRLPVRNPFGSAVDPVKSFNDAIENPQRAFELSRDALNSGDVSRVVRTRTATLGAIDQLQRVPSIAAKPDGLIREFIALLRDQYEMEQNIVDTGSLNAVHQGRANEQERRYNDLIRRSREWSDAEQGN